MTELEAARLVRAALRLIRDSFADCGALDATVSRWQHEIGDVIEGLEQAAPPWEPEPGPSAERPWSEVIPGDSVLAPNGTWYPVDSVARIGRTIKALLIYGDQKLPTVRDADERVKVERGDAGRAVDVFAAGGITLEPIGAGK